MRRSLIFGLAKNGALFLLLHSLAPFFIIFLTAQTKNKKSKIIWAVIKINGAEMAAAKTDLAEGARKKKKQNGKRNNSRRN